MKYFKKITVIENDKRLQALAEFRQIVITYFNNCKRDYFQREPSENVEAQKARVQINRIIDDIHSIILYSGASTSITVTPPPAIGGYIRNVDLVQNIFLLHSNMVDPQMLLDLIDRAIGIYHKNHSAALFRTFNPLFWVDRLFDSVASIPFYVFGKLGFNAQKAERSFLGRLIKGIGYLLTLFVSVLTALNLMGLLDDVKRFVANQKLPSITLQTAPYIDTVTVREYNLNTGVNDGPIIEKYAVKKIVAGTSLRFGLYTSYYQSGAIKSTLYYVNNLKVGPITMYQENGKISQTGYYKDDKKDSIWISFYDSGKTKEEATYRLGILNGKAKAWHHNGQISYYVSYSNDIIDTLMMWNDSGKLIRKTIYKGLSTISESCWNDKGDIIRCEEIISRAVIR